MPSIPAQLERVADMYEVEPRAHTAQRIGAMEKVAQTLSRKGQVAVKCEIANAALLQLALLLYEKDDDDKLANVDRSTRVLVPLPWGRVGCRIWGLRTTEGRCLRHIMLKRSAGDDAWLRYDGESRNWYLGKPLIRHAMTYLERQPITAAEWREAWCATRTAFAVDRLALG